MAPMSMMPPQQATTITTPGTAVRVGSEINSALAAGLERQLAAAMSRRDIAKAFLDGTPVTATMTPRARIARQRAEQDLQEANADVQELQGQLSQLRAQGKADVAVQISNLPAIAGTTVPAAPPGMGKNETIVTSAFIVFVLGPIAVAFAIRLIRRGWSGSVSNSREVTEMADRVRRIENAVETMAVEVERVSEGQRYLARTLGEQPAKPLASPAGADIKRA